MLADWQVIILLLIGATTGGLFVYALMSIRAEQDVDRLKNRVKFLEQCLDGARQRAIHAEHRLKCRDDARATYKGVTIL